jgi:hypothetical protein
MPDQAARELAIEVGRHARRDRSLIERQPPSAELGEHRRMLPGSLGQGDDLAGTARGDARLPGQPLRR